ncbi:hypothetical protein Dda_8922 [Drechslerella dactyloides]|uniref:Uncharacterized protein n=1 Tax=Drechslerella dactyloides TaxID=74499 RepID=A0AAD6NER7_DREDA|nr:hypothetical protein Dda_8922 [Drechslerella dactyloides]
MRLNSNILTPGRPEDRSAVSSQLLPQMLFNWLRLSISTIFFSKLLASLFVSAAPLSPLPIPSTSIPTIPNHIHPHIHIHRHHHPINSHSTQLPQTQQRSSTASGQIRPRDYGYGYAGVSAVSIESTPVVTITTFETILQTVVLETITATSYHDRRNEEEEGRQDEVDAGSREHINIDNPVITITTTTTTTTTSTRTSTIWATQVSNIGGGAGGQGSVVSVVSGSVPIASPGSDAGPLRSIDSNNRVAASVLKSAAKVISSLYRPSTTTSTRATGSSITTRPRVSSRHISSPTSRNYKPTSSITTSLSSSSFPSYTSSHSYNSTINGTFSYVTGTPTAIYVYPSGNTPIVSLPTAYPNVTSTLSGGYLITGAVPSSTSSSTASAGISSRICATSALAQVLGAGLFIIGGWILDAW